ncbi:MAG: hypothetical protein JO288_11300 [Hyphomicrobiales bacterium]|nr:hypothetical protein [Hyphomicrobiales bacterium]
MSARAPLSQSKIQGPGLRLQLLEVRAFWEHYAALALSPAWSAAARGDGHPVPVLPGLAAGDASTALLRRFLRSLGYAATGWGQGLNLGLRPGLLERAHEMLNRLRIEHGRAVSLVDRRHEEDAAHGEERFSRLVLNLPGA